MALAALRRCLLALEAGDPSGAHREAQRAEQRLATSPQEAVGSLVLGQALLLLRRPTAALRALERATRSDDRRVAAVALDTLASAAGQLGWRAAAREALEERLRETPTLTSARQRLADLLAAGRDWEGALAAVPPEHAGAPALAVRRATLLHELGDDEAALRALESLPVADPTAARHVADLRARCGDVEGALTLLRGVAEANLPASLQAAAWADCARLHLWRAEWEEAEDAAQRALALPSGPGASQRARVTRAAVLLAHGPSPVLVQPDDDAVAEALALLDAVLAEAPEHAEALLWRGQARAMAGRDHEALQDLDAGVTRGGGWVFAARLVHAWVEARTPSAQGRGDTLVGAWRELGPTLRELGLPAEGVDAAAGDLDAAGPLIDEALRRVAGNRSRTTTAWVDAAGLPAGKDVALRRVARHGSPRAQARRTLELVRATPADEVHRRFATLQAAAPDSAMPLVHQGELSLWCGDYDDAVHHFRHALALRAGTRWGYIGQMGALALSGRPEEALRVGDEGVRVMGGKGPSHAVYAGEALWQLGRLDEAHAALSEACALGPTRVFARISLALVHADRGDHGGMARELEAIRAPLAALFAAAAEDAGVAAELLWPVAGAADRAAEEAVLREAWRAIRGNRSSSCLTWFDRAGRMRGSERPSDRTQDPFGAERAGAVQRAMRLLDGLTAG